MITTEEHRAIVVVETDELQEMACSAVQDLGKQLRNKRSVEALVERFGKKIVSDPSPLRVEILDVVGYCDQRKDQPGVIEPIVIHEGKPVPISMTFICGNGDYWVGPQTEITTIRDRVVAGLARGIAEDLIRCEAMTGAINQADEDCILSGHSATRRQIQSHSTTMRTA